MNTGHGHEYRMVAPTPEAPPLRDVWRAFCGVRRQLYDAPYEQWLGATADRCQCSVQHVIAAIAVGALDKVELIDNVGTRNG